jgi:hypothetical protein
MVSKEQVVEFVRDVFGAPHRAANAGAPAATPCTIVAITFNGFAFYADGLLRHGPRSGEPAVAKFAEGPLLAAYNYWGGNAERYQGPRRPFQPFDDGFHFRIEIDDEGTVVGTVTYYGPPGAKPHRFAIEDRDQHVLRASDWYLPPKIGEDPTGLGSCLICLAAPISLDT